MKKLICWILMLMLGGTALAETAGNSLGVNALDTLYDGVHNQMVSPFSLAMALAMAADGANGDTKTEILNALNDSDTDWAALRETLTQSGLKIANAAFAGKDLEAKEDYIAKLQETYAAEWFLMGENAVDEINVWASEHTDGLIDKLVDSVPENDTQLILLNAAAMDAQWLSSFSHDATQDATFHTNSGDVTVSMMYQTDSFAYGETETAQLLKLSYWDSDLKMLIALPKEGHDEREVLSALKEQGLDYFSAIGEDTYLNLAMPKVDFAAENSLNDVLEAAGIQTAFTGQADFSGISDADLYLDKVVQKAHLTIDEAGTRAVAVTEICVAACALYHDDPIDFTMDHPFVAVIADETTGTICFAAVIANPSEN